MINNISNCKFTILSDCNILKQWTLGCENILGLDTKGGLGSLSSIIPILTSIDVDKSAMNTEQ